MKNKKTKILCILFVIALFALAGFLYLKIFRQYSSKTVNKVSTVDTIRDFNYTLKSNSSDYYKTLFKELKTILKSETLDEEAYAKKVAQLFTTDLFSLSDKVTSSDIGGMEFVYKDFREDFVSIAQSTLYSTVKSNVYGNRKQELPSVSEVIVINSNKKDFKYKDKTFTDSYYIDLEIKYKKDLGYPSKYQVVVSKNDDVYEVVKSLEVK